MNITGNYRASDWFRDVSSVTTEGAFFNDTSKGNRSATGVTGYSSAHTVGFDASRNWTGETSSFGGSQAHNIMNPYHACFIWRRES